MFTYFARVFVSLVVLAGSSADAQVVVPQVQLPGSIVAELKRVETRFEIALSQDCPAEKCFSRGCNYIAHETVDKPKGGSLPGLGDQSSGGPGSAPAQEYLKAARCEFAFESTLSGRDIGALQKRLEQKLSVGFMVVTVEPKPLPPLPAALKVTPNSLTPNAAPTAAPAQKSAAELAKETEWSTQTATRELWLQLLPHFSWMIAILLVTLSSMTILWAWRRVGKENLEEAALLKSLSDDAPSTGGPDSENGAAKPVVEDKVAREVKLPSESLLRQVLHQWLLEKNYLALAKALYTFSDAVSNQLSSLPDMAIEKAELSSFLKTFNLSELPSNDEFAGQLERALLSARVESLPDVTLYRTLSQQFAPQGLAKLFSEMPARLAAISFAILPRQTSTLVARLIEQSKRIEIMRSLLASNRASSDDVTLALEYARAAFGGHALPQKKSDSNSSFDRGREIDVGPAVSVIIGSLPQKERKDLVIDEIKKAQAPGVAELLASHVFFPEMLLKLPREMRSTFLLEVEPRDLSVWLTKQNAALKSKLIEDAPTTLQNLLKAQPASGEGDVSAITNKVEKRFLELLSREYAGGRLRVEELI